VICKRFFLIPIFLFSINFSFGEINISEIKPKTVLYKSIDNIDLNLYIYRPENFDSSKIYNCIVFFHGGAWNNQYINQFERQSIYFASRGMIAFIAEYRVTSLHNSTPFQSVEDAKSAIRYIRSNAKSLSLDPEKIAVSGGSAGAHLAAASANISNYDNVNENLKISSKPNLLILFNPILDTTPGAWGYGSFMRRVGNKITDNPYEISPIHHISKKTPPTIILSGTNDNLVPVIKINQYKEIMISNNVRCDVIFYKDAEHSFFNKGEDFVDTVYQLDLFLKSNGYLSGDPTIKN
jgi:acetyl esterase/lipase